MKNLLTVAEILFENREELQNRVEAEQQNAEDYKREIYALKQRNEAILVK